MRKFTLLLSVIVHLAVAIAVFMAPLFAAEALPVVRDARPAWMPVATAVLPEVPRRTPPRPPSPSEISDVAPQAASFPTQAPDVLQPESAPPPLWSAGLAESRGVPAGLPGSGAGDPFAAPPPAPASAPRAPLRVGGAVEPPRKIVHVAPVYPPIAVAARREGRVILEAVIAEDGSVGDVRVLRSVPLLDQAAIDAVRQWRFTPTRLNGEPVQVLMSVTVAFVLQ
jgi:protein TonB